MWKKLLDFISNCLQTIFDSNGEHEQKIIKTGAYHTPIPPIEEPVLSGTIPYPKPLTIPYTTDILYLEPEMAKDIPEFLRVVEAKGIDIKITCTARTYRCQVALYAQGRQKLSEINKLRKLAGLYLITQAEAKKKVTWTLVSKHLVNYDDTDPNNDYSQAFDFVIRNGRKVSWDAKVDTNENDFPDYEEVGKIAESFGWTWGGRWKSKDLPHVQMKRRKV